MRWILLTLFSLRLASACSVVVAAAADLQPLEKRIAEALPGCKVSISFASSGTLARQIQHGADFDVYLAASKSYVDSLVQAGAADSGTVAAYARGRLGVWSRKGLRWGNLSSPAASRIAIANPVHAPYGLAAKQALERQGLWASIEKKLVYGENVRQAWQFAVTGNADAVIGAWSLMHDQGGQLLPESWHEPIVQTAVVPKRSRNPEAAKRLLAWLLSDAGQTMLGAHGLDRVRP